MQCTSSAHEEKYLNSKILKLVFWSDLHLNLTLLIFLKENMKSNFMLKREIHLVTLSGDLCASVY
jgi:predicted MPP superfamily phosphohydrolase